MVDSKNKVFLFALEPRQAFGAVSSIRVFFLTPQGRYHKMRPLDQTGFAAGGIEVK